MAIRLGINGACGRMGRTLVRAALADPTIQLTAALEAPGHVQAGQDVGHLVGGEPAGIVIQPDLPAETAVDAIVDFSAPAGTMSILPACIRRRIALVVATTGHATEAKKALDEAANHTAVLVAANTSLGLNVLASLVRNAARMLCHRDFDVEIVEQHHRFKKDAPSGTALYLARVIAGAGGPAETRHGRQGDVGERSRGEVGIHAVRAGDNVGEHHVIFATLGETLELAHRAQSRACYARGALQAAKFLAGRPPGRYSMDDVLGFR